MKQPKINQEVELTLKFKVVADKYGTCFGCWAKVIDSPKCLMIRELLGSCFANKREDGKSIIYKLIKEKE